MKIIYIITLVVSFLYSKDCNYLYENKKIVIKTNDNYGCEYDNRELNSYDNDIKLLFKTDKNENMILKIFDENKYVFFDIYNYSAPEKEKIRDIIYLKDINLLGILHGYHAIIREEDNNIGIDAVFYSQSYYKIFNNFPLKILFLDNKTGIDGFYWGKRKKYLDKEHKQFQKSISFLKITNNMILNSLEEFIKPTYSKKYDTSFSFKDSFFNVSTIKTILNEVPISLSNLTKYNNIAYYLEQAEAYKESIFLLEKIIEKYPNRTVAYINLADSYLKNGNKEKAIENYKIYVKQMKEKNKDKKIPKRVLKIIDDSKILDEIIKKETSKGGKTTCQQN